MLINSRMLNNMWNRILLSNEDFMNYGGGRRESSFFKAFILRRRSRIKTRLPSCVRCFCPIEKTSLVCVGELDPFRC